MKKLNKYLASLVAMAMIGSTSAVAFAEDLAPNQEPAPADANLVKYLQVAEGVSVPTVTFTYQFTPEYTSANGLTPATMPAIGDIDATSGNRTGTTTLSTANKHDTGVKDDGASVYMAKSLDQILNAANYTKAGLYIYSVKELAQGFTNTDDQIMTYDETVYLLRVYVTIDEDTGELEINNVTVQEAVTDNDGNVVKDEDTGMPEGTGGKEDATVEDPTIPDETKDDYDDKDTEDKDDDTGTAEREQNGSIKTEGFTFTNLFTVKQDEPFDPDNPTDPSIGAIAVKKTVDAENAQAKASSFPFVMTVTPATGHEADETYVTAYKYTKNADTGAYVKGAAVTFTKSGANWVGNFNLADGEYVAIESIPAGTRYEVLENNGTYKPTYFTPKYVITAAGAQKDAKNNAKAGDTLKTENILLAKTDTGDLVAYTNDFDDDLNTPTGILINNLPYIVLALVAVGGLVAYVVVRRKNEDEA